MRSSPVISPRTTSGAGVGRLARGGGHRAGVACGIAGRSPSGSSRGRPAGGETVCVEAAATTGYAPPPREMQDPTYEPPRRSHSIARRRSCSSIAALTSGVIGAQPATTMVRINTALTRARAFMRYIPLAAASGAAFPPSVCSRSQDSLLVDDAGEGLAGQSMLPAGTTHSHRRRVTRAMRSKSPS